MAQQFDDNSTDDSVSNEEAQEKDDDDDTDDKENSFLYSVNKAIKTAKELNLREQHLRDLVRELTKQNGAWGLFELEDYVYAHLFQLTQLLVISKKLIS